jgi:hypothetical protein
MKSSLMLLLFASAFITGCAGSSPLAPDTASVPSAKTNATGSSAPRTFLPPINPAGISCPSDAPQVVVGSLATRLDIEFSEVAGAYAYEIEIMNYFGAITRLEITAPAHRADWYGVPGMYRVRVRTINCGGVGNWSAELYQTLDDGTLPPPKPPVEVPPPPPPTTPPAEPPTTPPTPTEPPADPPTEPKCMVGCF